MWQQKLYEVALFYQNFEKINEFNSKNLLCNNYICGGLYGLSPYGEKKIGRKLIKWPNIEKQPKVEW